ncbi:hypothetical protein K438DRAFT_1942408, partial [Mycena galopus ATCC 62051]
MSSKVCAGVLSLSYGFPFIFGSGTDYCSANFGHTNIQFRLLPFIFSSDDFPFIFGSSTDYCSANFGHTNIQFRLLPFIFSSDDFPFIFGSDCSHLSSAATTFHSSSAAVRITDYCSANFGHTNIQFRLLPFIFSSVRTLLAILTFNLDCSHSSSAIAFGHSACNVPPGIRMSRLPIRRRGSRQGSRPSSRHTLSRSETLLSLSP